MNDKDIRSLFSERQGVIATMHKKEQVIAPIMEKELGLEILIPSSFDTDIFGTFTREVERAGNQLEAARKKAKKAMKKYNVAIGISSEGSFGPHPVVPFLPFNRELVLFIDLEQDLEIQGFVANSNTNYAQKEVTSVEEAFEFALSIGFPEHGIIAHSIDRKEMIKGITEKNKLEEAIHVLKKNQTKIGVETDMRAMYNPTRMKNIELATLNLLSNIKSVCPSCHTPGYEVMEVKKGLPCEICRFPTALVLSHLKECKKCAYKEEIMYPNGVEFADPARCDVCNP